ncbi:DUF5753 domain-containing protein [Streptomyces bacillaris]|uniref:DUF5753 domain-containing protein n=1 Tax=Streptomyces bacillaris TaxID=68179 RepID=UPI00345F47B8
MQRVHESTVPLYERTAHFRVYASTVLPGMVQTAGYATGLPRSITDFQGTPDDVPKPSARLARSRVVHQGDHRLALLIEEAVLHHPVCDGPELAGQLRYLYEVMSRPNVSLGIIPLGARRRTVWPLEAFYTFDDAQVAVETLTAEVNITAPGEVRTYLRAFAELSRIAVHGAPARDLIARAMRSALSG